MLMVDKKTLIKTKSIEDVFEALKEYSENKLDITDDFDKFTYLLLINKDNIINSMKESYQNPIKLNNSILLPLSFNDAMKSLNENVNKRLISESKYSSRESLVGKHVLTIENKQLKSSQTADIRELFRKNIYLNENIVKEFLSGFENIQKIILPIESTDFINVKKNSVGFYSTYFEYQYYYDVVFKTIKETVSLKQLTIILSPAPTNIDYLFWRKVVKVHLSKEVKVGFMIDSLLDLYEIDNLNLVDECFVDIETMITTYQQENFEKDYIFELRDIKGLLEEKNAKTTLMITQKDNFEAINKFLKMGFKNYNYDVKLSETIELSLNSYIKRRKNQ